MEAIDSAVRGNGGGEMKTGAVIAAAGMSSRMKAFKPLLALGGSTIIGTAVDTLRSAGIGPIVVITGNGAEKLEPYLGAAGVTCLYNARYETTDMFASARIGMDYMRDRCDRMFFLPGDVPLFSRQSLERMMDDMDCSRCEIIMPVHAGVTGHPILIASRAIPSLLRYKGGNGLKGAIDGFEGGKETIELDDIGMTMDADWPEDYEKLKEYDRRRAHDTDTADV